MGCGQSAQANQIGVDAESKKRQNNNRNEHIKENGHVQSKKASPVKNKENAENNNIEKRKNKSNKLKSENPLPPLASSKPVAFDVNLDGDLDKIIKKHPPRKLQKLDPLQGASKLTAEDLMEKQRLAEEKRQRQLEKKKETSRRSSRLRQNILQAKQIDEQHNTQEILDEKQRSADRNREAKQREIEEKKRLREERARKIRERARKIKQLDGAEDLDFEVEKDETYNNDDGNHDDSWTEGGNNRQIEHNQGDQGMGRFDSDLSERIYSGRSSPKKMMDQQPNKITRGSAFSTDTADSFDFAFQRPSMSTVESEPRPYDRSKRDDFFD